jgi:hypothetical protein
MERQSTVQTKGAIEAMLAHGLAPITDKAAGFTEREDDAA